MESSVIFKDVNRDSYQDGCLISLSAIKQPIWRAAVKFPG